MHFSCKHFILQEQYSLDNSYGVILPQNKGKSFVFCKLVVTIVLLYHNELLLWAQVTAFPLDPRVFRLCVYVVVYKIYEQTTYM